MVADRSDQRANRMRVTLGIGLLCAAALGAFLLTGERQAAPKSDSVVGEASGRVAKATGEAPPTGEAQPTGGAAGPQPKTDLKGLVRTISASELRPVASPADGFATSDACQECHAEQHQTWQHSFHRTMTQVVNAETAPKAICDTHVTMGKDEYGFQQKGDKFYVTFEDPLVGGQVRTRELLMMTGSHHMHVFWYETEKHGTPGQLDIVYLIDEERWIPRESSFLQPPDMEHALELGTWNRTCSRCHSTNAREGFHEDTEDWDTRVAEFGISCEACHGEGQKHVEFYRNQQLVSQPGDSDSEAGAKQDQASFVDSLINPAGLSKQASADACGQCHSIFMPDYEVISQMEFMRDGNPFRPGELLTDLGFSKLIQASPEHRGTETYARWSEMESAAGSFWSDGMARIAGREYNGLVESSCFVAGEMTCLSCHEMHPPGDQNLDEWRDDQLKANMRGDHACLQCHPSYESDISAHTHHAADSEGSRCMNCHMPHTTFGLLKTVRSHQISSPTIQASQTTDRVNACSLCHLDQGFDWVSGHLNDWYDQPLPDQDAGKIVSGESENKTEANKPPPIATSVLHLLSGDAAQRAVVVAAMGRKPAQEASGTEWMEPLLWLALNDPYDAVRLVADKSLRGLPGRVTKPIDPLAPAAARMEAFNLAIEKIDKQFQQEPRPEILVNEDGHFDFPRARDFLINRNHRPIWLHE